MVRFCAICSFHSVFCRMIDNDFSTGVHEDMFVPAIKVREGEGVT